MSDDISSGLQVAGVVVSAIAPIAIWMHYDFHNISEDPKPRFWTRCRTSIIGTVLLAWIWFPWVGYGVYRLAKWNQNNIDYCERAKDVIPVKPATIDLNTTPPSDKQP